MELTVKSTSYSRSWDSPNGTIYYFNITFNDGQSGEFSTIFEDQNKFIIGETYNVKSTIKKNQYGKDYTFYDIDKEFKKRYDGPKTGDKFESYYDKPEVVKEISATHALTMAIKYLEVRSQDKVIKQDTIYKIADKFFSYYSNNISDSLSNSEKSKIVLRRRQSIEQAILCNKIICEWEDIITVNDILELANKFINYHNGKI